MTGEQNSDPAILSEVRLAPDKIDAAASESLEPDSNLFVQAFARLVQETGITRICWVDKLPSEQEQAETPDTLYYTMSPTSQTIAN